VSVPRLVVVLELERRAWVYADVLDDGEERRLLLDLSGRDWPDEVVRALAQLLDTEDAA
jgi:hypothetical protein